MWVDASSSSAFQHRQVLTLAACLLCGCQGVSKTSFYPPAMALCTTAQRQHLADNGLWSCELKPILPVKHLSWPLTKEQKIGARGGTLFMATWLQAQEPSRAVCGKSLELASPEFPPQGLRGTVGKSSDNSPKTVKAHGVSNGNEEFIWKLN